MRKYASVAMAAVRPIVWKLLIIIFAMAAVEIALFLIQWNHALQTSQYVDTMYFLSNFYVRIAYSLALMAVTAVLLRQGGWLYSGKSGYTVHRLPVSEIVVVLVWAGVYFAAYLILHGAQLGVILGLWQVFGEGDWLYLAMGFYTEKLLHGLFPMENIYRHVYNLLWPMCMSLSLSFAAYSRRRGTEQTAPYALLAVPLLYMGSHYDVYALEIMKMVAVAALTVISVCYAWRSAHGEN